MEVNLRTGRQWGGTKVGDSVGRTMAIAIGCLVAWVVIKGGASGPCVVMFLTNVNDSVRSPMSGDRSVSWPNTAEGGPFVIT